ncbi:MAG TPA: LysR family transcriptional regulator [Enhygromyxa sp.]|nr:LysR family transcriptional regulator [Enhygromyxa sp.]
MSEPFSGVLSFTAVAEARSFKLAAERLGVSSAAVSKAVARLEHELGVRLLDRTTRRVEPTAEGALYLEHCRGALEQLRLGRERLEQTRSVAAGELTVALPFILGRHLVARLPRFSARYPQVRVALRLSDRISRLVDEQIDVAIRIGALADSTAIARKLGETRWVTVAAPAYLARRGTPQRPEQLIDHDCVVFHSPRGVEVGWQFVDGPRSRQGREWRVSARINLDQGQLLVDAAVAGLGIVQVFSYMVSDELERGELVEVLGEHACAGPPIHALCKPGQQGVAKVRALLDFLVEQLGC